MVMEVQLQDGSWTAFVSERTPQEPDDAIKGHPAEFYMAAKDLTPEDLQEAIPMSFPMTHLLKEFPGIARYPVDAWETAGAPFMSVRSWCKLCMRVAGHNMASLEKIFEIAKKVGGGVDETKETFSAASGSGGQA